MRERSRKVEMRQVEPVISNRFDRAIEPLGCEATAVAITGIATIGPAAQCPDHLAAPRCPGDPKPALREPKGDRGGARDRSTPGVGGAHPCNRIRHDRRRGVEEVPGGGEELSPNFGDGLKDQAAAWA
jgi:hypothetical protein